MKKETIRDLCRTHCKQLEVLRMIEEETDAVILSQLTELYSQYSARILELTGMAEQKALEAIL